MSFLFAKPAQVIPALTGLQIQTSVNTLPIPLIYGSPRVPMNVIYINGFRHTKAKGSGGKGLGIGGKNSSGQYDYYATFMGALGEGDTSGIIEIYDNQNIYTVNTLPSGKTIIFFSGTSGQTAWSFITSNWPADAFGYKDTAYLAFPDYHLDSSGTLPMLNFMISGIYAGTVPVNTYTSDDGTPWLLDADPALVIPDFLDNPRYGAGFPGSYIDFTTLNTSADGLNPLIGDAAVSTYCQAVGLAWSLVVNNYEPASSILDRWCKNLVVAPVWTGAVLKFIPYYDSPNDDNPGLVGGGTPKYYTPNITPLFDFGDSDFIQAAEGEDPVVATRIDIADVKNVVRVEFKDRSNQGNSNIAEAKDETAVELFGSRIERAGSADEFNYIVYAGASANLQLQRNLSVRNTYTFRLDWRWCILDPMDIVTITDVVLGLDKFPVRIRSIEEDEKGILTILAEEFPAASATSTAYPLQPNAPPILPINAIPAAVNPPVIFEPTALALAAQNLVTPQIVIGVSGGPAGAYDSNWGGCIVNVSDDGVTYVNQGTFNGPSTMGLTTATLAAFASANPDNTNTLSVDLSMSNGALETVSSSQAAAGLNLCAIVDANGDLELLSFATATLMGPNTYDLTELYRGLYGTVACSHASGVQFLRIDSNVFEAPLPPAFIGVPLSVKLQSFNIFANSIQDITTCTVYPYTPIAAGFDPSTNPIASALLAGSPVDLGNVGDTISATLDLNAGGIGTCSPSLFEIDLGVL